jgi:hypothetical protein
VLFLDIDKRFTVKLAAVDMLPVLFFSIAVAVLGMKLQSRIFLIGAIVCIIAGAGKVLWKFLIALAGKDVMILGAQLRYLMPVGFVFIVAGILTADRTVVFDIIKKVFIMPSAVFFIFAVICICGMIICAGKYDRHDVRGNWIEQIINAAAQACVMLGVLFM